MFTNLYIKTNYSLLSSLVSINDLITYCKNKDIKSIAICDDNMNACKLFYNECIKNNIKPIIGLDVAFNDNNILLYAKDYAGYKNLIKIATILSDRKVELDDLKKLNKNLLSIIPFDSSNLYDYLKEIYSDLYIGYSNKIEENAAKKITKNIVFINKVLYLYEKHSKYLKYLYMVRDSKTILDDINFKDNYNYILNDEIYNLSSIEGINNTNLIADMCNISFPKPKNMLPIFNKEIDSNEYLLNLSIKGLNKRLNNNVPNNYKERLLYEFNIIKQMGYSNYFLIVYDFIRYSKKNNILVGPGRGSAAGSLVAYSLGITEIDPIKYDLLFERFLNPERITMPDIDTDFPDIYREKVIEYVRNKYGEKKVAGIITFGTMASKLALRDIGRVLNIPIQTIDKLCSFIPNVTKLKLKDFYSTNTNFKNLIDSSDKLKLLYEICSIVEGFPRHISMHAAGIVMSEENLDEIIPLVKNDNIYMSGYSMDYLEELGLLKMDFLGLKNLTIIMNIINDINNNLGINIDFSSIPLDDKETLELFKNANTCGIFQFESEGMKKFLLKLKANTLEDIFAAIALFRPGPSNNIDSYIRRKQGIENIDYIDNSLENVLKPTYGIIIYQEQIMQIASIMAGYSLAEADLLRRAMSKKKETILKSEREKFISNSVNRGYSLEVAKKTYDLILEFANYGFNKSHSVSYSIIAYKMAYLKCKYPKYFFSNLLSSVIGSESKIIEYINEAKKLGIKILLPDINKSMNFYTVESDGIRSPLSIIKKIGVVTCNDIISSRNTGFTDIYDCFSKIVSKNVNKSILESLIFASCFESFGYNKKTLIENLDNLINYAYLTKDLDSEFVLKPDIEIKEEYTKEILISSEKEIFGYYLSNHPTSIYKSKYDDIIDINQLEKYYNKIVKFIVIVEKIRIVKTKNNENMAFISASDNTAKTDFTVFPSIYNLNNNVKKGDVLLIEGNIEKRYDKYQVIVKNIKNIN